MAKKNNNNNDDLFSIELDLMNIGPNPPEHQLGYHTPKALAYHYQNLQAKLRWSSNDSTLHPTKTYDQAEHLAQELTRATGIEWTAVKKNRRCYVQPSQICKQLAELVEKLDGLTR